MLDFLYFFAQQFFNIFSFLDNIVFFNTLSLLKVLMIIAVFTFALKIIHKGEDK